MMRDAPDEAVVGLLDRWKRGDRDDEAWYRLLSGPLRRGAWQGIQRMTGQPPNDDDVGEVVYNAFKEFRELDPATITTVWASPDLQRLLGTPPEEELGYGLHVVEAFRLDAWRQIATPETQSQLMSDLGPVLTNDAPFAKPFQSSFDYLEPGGESELPVMRVNLLVTPLHDDAGAFIGTCGLGFMSVRPWLVSLLARGDETMYERMAKLVEPGSREAAILFCDLEGSTELARTLPTGEYFRLIRSLWTEIDALVARHEGIVGKHAGDGASAFFLVDDLGSASRVASAAVRTARGIHERSDEIFGAALDSSCLMRVGIHWGGSLYIGQLVPGGRLDVTALGDAVNECARIQESAAPHQTLASKELIEHLSHDDAAALGLDPEKFRYVPLSRVAGASEKAVAAAGTIAVIPIESADEAIHLAEGTSG